MFAKRYPSRAITAPVILSFAILLGVLTATQKTSFWVTFVIFFVMLYFLWFVSAHMVRTGTNGSRKIDALVMTLLKPYIVVPFTVMLSFIAWLKPFSILRSGFTTPEPLTVEGISFLLLWYITITSCAWIGYTLGSNTRPIPRLNVDNMYGCYLVLVLIAVAGIIATYVSIGLPEAIAALQQRQANQLRIGLYSNYILGIHSLRYASIVAAPLGGYYLITSKGSKALHILSLAALFFNALISSRMSLIMAVMLFVGMITTRNGMGSLRRWHWLIIGVLTFTALVYFNWSRNYTTYAFVWETRNPITMALAEIQTYLAAPFQVSLGVGNNLDLLSPPSLHAAVEALLPTYTDDLFGFTFRSMDVYRARIDVELSLTTNSALAELCLPLGYLAFPFIGLISLLASYIAGHFAQYRNQMVMASYLVTYGFAELWRTYLFRNGILQFTAMALILATLFAPIKPLSAVNSSHGRTSHGNEGLNIWKG